MLSGSRQLFQQLLRRRERNSENIHRIPQTGIFFPHFLFYHIHIHLLAYHSLVNSHSTQSGAKVLAKPGAASYAKVHCVITARFLSHTHTHTHIIHTHTHNRQNNRPQSTRHPTHPPQPPAAPHHKPLARQTTTRRRL